MGRFSGAAFGLALAVVASIAPAAAVYQFEATVVRVIDGDTFEIRGGERVRVRNFDTAELRRYGCAEERAAAVAARTVARDWLDGRQVSLFVDGEDRYGRLVADVIVYGPDGPYSFADRMAAEGFGAHWDYGAEPQPDWCAGARPAEGWSGWVARLLGAG